MCVCGGGGYIEIGNHCHHFKPGGQIPWCLTREQTETTNLGVHSIDWSGTYYAAHVTWGNPLSSASEVLELQVCSVPSLSFLPPTLSLPPPSLCPSPKSLPLCWGLDPGPCTSKASALALNYIPSPINLTFFFMVRRVAGKWVCYSELGVYAESGFPSPNVFQVLDQFMLVQKILSKCRAAF